MPNLHEISKEINPQTIISKYISLLCEETKRNVIVYYSGWLNHTQPKKGLEINDLDKNAFMSVIHGLDKNKGVDLILHTPGGDVGATESLIDYLYESFDGDIRAIVPQLAMSGGTMIACSCKEIIMGKQSSLGPIDPQFKGIPAEAIIKEFERAKVEVASNPETIPIWQTMLTKYPPAFVVMCENARKLSDEILEKSLTYAMFNEENRGSEEIILDYLREFIRQFQLNILNKYNLINPNEIIKFVLDNDDLIELIQKVNPLIRSYFPNHIYCLEFVPDPEFSNLNQLVCYIKIDDSVFDEEWKVLKQLNKEIRHSICSNSKSLFSVDLW